MVCHTTPYFSSIYITFVNSKSFFKSSGRTNILLTTIFAGHQKNNISTITLQNLLNFISPLASKASKVRRNYKKFLLMSYFLLHFSIEHFLCLVGLGNNDGDKISLKFLFLLYVTLMPFTEKYQSLVDYCIK